MPSMIQILQRIPSGAYPDPFHEVDLFTRLVFRCLLLNKDVFKIVLNIIFETFFIYFLYFVFFIDVFNFGPKCMLI